MVVVGKDEVAEVARWAEGIERVHECIAGRFRRPEPRRRALEYLKGLLNPGATQGRCLTSTSFAGLLPHRKMLPKL